MSITREYHDAEGNYWMIETPEYMPPEEAIKHPEYVRYFVSAADRKKAQDSLERFQRYSRNLRIGFVIILVILAVAVVLKG